jgi:FkbM family methyltransferase
MLRPRVEAKKDAPPPEAQREESPPGNGEAPPAPQLCRTMEQGLEVLARRHPIATVIDVGASNGMWSRLARPHFPDAAYLLIEAQGLHHERDLALLKASDPTFDYVIAAAGNHEGILHFYADAPLGGVASETHTGKFDIIVPATTIDLEVTRRSLRPPFLIKLDTHGFEVPILEGAAATLASTGALVIEAYGFELQPGTLRFHQLCAYLEVRGFRCIDIVDVMYRPSDGALWQMDLFFVPSSSPEFSVNTYQ